MQGPLPLNKGLSFNRQLIAKHRRNLQASLLLPQFSMCRYNKLHQCRYGYVIECRQCRCIQVAFGTSLLTLSPGQFNEFVDIVGKLATVQHSVAFPDQKAIIVPVESTRINMICSSTELKQLQQLLLRGRNSLEMSKLFIFHEN